MKTKNVLLLIAFAQMLSLSLHAQFNRANTKKSITYRANHQKVGGGSVSNSAFELRGGELWAWGYNATGQLGDGTTTNKTSPVQIGTATDWSTLSSGSDHTTAIKTDGTLWAWGSNINSQVGDGTTTNRLSPVQIGTDNKWICVSSGSQFTLALKSNGTLWAWGINTFGQLGNGSVVSQNTPVQIGTENKWTAISTGNTHVLALKSDGTLWSWGNNLAGQLGDGTNTVRTSPVQIGTGTAWATVSCGSQFSMALKSNGTLWSWGGNASGQLSDGSSTDRNTPAQVGSDNNWVSVSLGNTHSLALKSNGTLWACGSGGNGQLGNGFTGGTQTNFIQIGTDNKWVGITAGSYNSLAYKANGNVYAWGAGNNGQMGDGMNVAYNVPTQVISNNINWLAISAGQSFTLGIRSNGTLWTWGDNAAGQLGDGTAINRNGPTQIGTSDNWICAIAGSTHSLGIKSDGTLWAWGDNQLGQLGDATTTNKNVPTQVGTNSDWVSVSAGALHSIGLKSDGTLWTWGANTVGQIGDGTSATRLVPTQVGTDNDWVSLGCGRNHTMGIKSNGTLWAWGGNSSGALGDGTTTNRNAPVQIGTDNNWVSVNGGFQSRALKTTGTIWGTGLNTQGQLGDGTNTNRISFVQVGSDDKWIGINSGFQIGAGIKSNGTLWTWGANSSGQLGDGTTVNKNAPVQIGTNTNWISIAGGELHSSGLKSTRDAYCSTGRNLSGQLGDYSFINSTAFICVSCLAPNAPTVAGQIICSGTTATLSAIGSGTIAWYDVATGGANVFTGASFTTPALTNTTTYYAEDNTCMASLTRTAVVVTVNQTPTVFSNDVTVCEGSTADLEASSDVGIIYWYANSSGGSSLATGPNYTTPVLINNATYYIEADNNGCLNNPRFAVNVTVNPMPTVNVTNMANTLTVDQSGAIVYQWRDCNNGNAVIAGETNQSFSPAQNGDYRVEVNLNGCVDLSACVAVSTIGIKEVTKYNAPILFPNPTTGAFSISFIDPIERGEVKVVNSIGQTVFTSSIENQNKIELNIEGEAGIYFVRINNLGKQESSNIKLIKQ